MLGSFGMGIAVLVAAAWSDSKPPPQEFVLEAGDLSRPPGLVEAVNAPEFTERPIVGIVGGRVVIRARFRPYALVDARGGPLEVVPPSGWPSAYATLARGEVLRVALRVPVGDGSSLDIPWVLRGPPTAVPVVAYRRAAVISEGAPALEGDTVTALVGRTDGLAALLSGWT